MYTQHQITQGFACNKRTRYLYSSDNISTKRSLQQFYGHQFKSLVAELLNNKSAREKLNVDFSNIENIQFNIEHDSVKVAKGHIDALIHNKNGDTNLIVISAKTRLDEGVDIKVACQLDLALSYNGNIKHIYVIYVDNKYASTKYGMVKVKDYTDSRMFLLRLLDDKIAKMSNKNVRSCRIGPHCNVPFPCEFKSLCHADCDTKYPIHTLPWYKESNHTVKDIRALDVDEVTNHSQKMVIEAVKLGKEVFRKEVSIHLDALNFPIRHVDFETVAMPVPVWSGIQAYERVPFQWSCHTEYESGKVTHQSFLSLSTSDPRRAFAETLIETLAKKGSILVYHKSVEMNILKQIGRWYPDLNEDIKLILNRIVDLLPIVKEHYYHPDMEGSWSIKRVAPCLCPEINYKFLDGVQNGEDAQLAFMEFLQGTLEAQDVEQLRSYLLDYCELDTYSMVVILKALRLKCRNTK